jgi:hypothetical protein
MMAFSAKVIGDAWRRAKGCCERCGKKIVWDNRGREDRGCWEAHHKSANDQDVLSNCEILCFDCHRKTRSFGVGKKD